MVKLLFQSAILITLLGACDSNLQISVYSVEGGDNGGDTGGGNGGDTNSTLTFDASGVVLTQKSTTNTILDAGYNGADVDANGNPITYECWFDTTQNEDVTESSGTECVDANLAGISFDSATGILTWNPSDSQAGLYEFKIKGTSSGGSAASYHNLVVSSANLNATSSGWAQEAYIKSSNNDAGDYFGISLSLDGDTLSVGAIYEESNQTTITNGDTSSADNSNSGSGAVYIYKRSGATWAQEAYIKASNNDANDIFGNSLSLDGDTLSVGAYREASNQTTITNGDTSSADNSNGTSGAVYIYKRSGATWAQEAYIKASNNDANDIFGNSLSLDGDTLSVGAPGEDSNQTTITNGDTSSADNSNTQSGAVYIYKRSGTTWAQEAYIKASNNDASDNFGNSLSLDGDTLSVGAYNEESNQTTITNGDTSSADNSNSGSGAVYIYKRSGATWAQEAYIKASNNDANDIFGNSLSLDGDTLSVGAPGEDSNQTTITNGDTSSADNSNSLSGAVYIYKRSLVYDTGSTTNSPELDNITPASIAESDGSIQVFNLNDGGDDLDDDGDTLAYSCWFDTVQDDSVAESTGTICNDSNLTGLSFDSSTGILTWDPSNGQGGVYEFKVIATDNNSVDTEYVNITVADDV